uniref:MOR2-PAG1_N domain-containing protein n=1 Tax=Taenia asiatica TaxID=60517 RepID=A0A0R3VZM0_TAEAS
LEHWDCDIAECPLVLSVLVLAVATHHNLRCGISAVAGHYDALKTLATAKMEESGTFPSPKVEKELMRSALELMSVYEHYVSLCRLLTALQEGSRIPDLSSAAYNRFSPIYEMFPSLALLVYMAAHLKCEATPSVVAMRLWVVHAFLRTNTDANDGARLKDTLTVFSTLLKCVSTVKLTFAAPKVKVIDPPSYFLPKNERPLRRSHAHPRDNEVPLKPRDNSVAAVMQSGGERS